MSVWREVRALMPHESLLYYGDGKNCPYGPKPQAEVIGYVDAAARFLIGEKGAKMLVVACNAATAMAIDFLRAKYTVPIVGMEPAVKPAATSTRTGVVGILATANTLRGTLYNGTVARYSDRAKILQAVGEGFVELVEAGREDMPEAVEIVRAALEPMLLADADRIVLGCTHYPFLAPAMRRVIEQVLGPGGVAADGRKLPAPEAVQLVDPAPAVARRAQDLLVVAGLTADPGHVPVYEFYTAADGDYLARLRAKSEAAGALVL